MLPLFAVRRRAVRGPGPPPIKDPQDRTYEVTLLNKGKKALFLGLGGLLCAGAGLAWLIAPGRATAEQRAVVQHRYFAHRGLYDSRAGIPENSLAAFRRAAEHGYGAELDVRMTRDGRGGRGDRL